jgi:hypothetical protein
VLFFKGSDGGIEGYAVHPGCEFRFAPEGGKRLPQLGENFLEKIVPILRIVAIDVADLVDDSLVSPDDIQKFLFQTVRIGRGM